MTDAYRTAAFLCPSCPEAPLREFGTRLVCDACDGILLTVEEFAAQAGSAEVQVVDEGAAALPCPRCLRPMRGCELIVGRRRVDHPLVRCERDGIWFGNGALMEVFEAIGTGSLRGASGAPSHRGYSRLFGGVVAGDGMARRPTTLDHRPRKLPPMEHSAPVPPSALRDRDLRCPDPACKRLPLRYEVSRWCCDDCDGLFVENGALEALVTEMSGQPWQLPPVSGAPGGRRCPACASALAVEPLEGETVDRCAEHGVWFDRAELEGALQHAVGVEPAPGGGSWLRRLFWR